MCACVCVLGYIVFNRVRDRVIVFNRVRVFFHLGHQNRHNMLYGFLDQFSICDQFYRYVRFGLRDSMALTDERLVGWSVLLLMLQQYDYAVQSSVPKKLHRRKSHSAAKTV